MPATAEVIEIVTILNEEGFGVIAGEVLTELNLGREVLPSAHLVENRELSSGDSFVDLGNGRFVSRLYSDEAGGRGEAEVFREPIPDKQQLEFVMQILRLRLVEPVRAWAEAEEIAGDILREEKSGGGKSDGSPDPVRIAFVPPFVGAPPRMERDAAPGSIAGTDDLAKVLDLISRLDA